MADDNDLEAEVEDQAQGPQTIQVDGQRITQRPISEVMDAAKFKQANDVDPFGVLAANSKKVTH